MSDPPTPRNIRDVEAIAAEVARAASETGLGFLLARIATDQILEGALSTDPSMLRRELYGRAAELVLSDRRGAEVDADRVLLQAASVVSSAGIPLGDVWEAAAVALRSDIDASLEAQLDLLKRRRRFIVAERIGDQVLYGLFHPALRDYFAGLRNDAPGIVASALVDLRDRQASGWAATDRVAPFLLSHLPELLADEVDVELLERAVSDAPADIRDAQVHALVEASRDRHAVGDRAGALERSIAAVTIATRNDVLTPATVEAFLAYAESLLLEDYWRDARDWSTAAIGAASQLLDDDDADFDPVPLRLYVRAVCRYVRAQGSGAFDVGEGILAADAAVAMLEGAAPTALAAIGADVADLLLSYSDSLGNACPPVVVIDSLDAAAQILRGFIQQGHRELGPQLAMVKTHRGGRQLAVDDPKGYDSLREAAKIVLRDAPFRPLVMREVTQIIGELAQNLAIVGHHAEALQWLDQFIEAYEPGVRAARPHEAHALALVNVLLLRSAVYAALGRDEEALADARRATALEDTHPIIVQRHDAWSVLGLRLLEGGHYDEARQVTDHRLDTRGRPRTTGERVDKLAYAMHLDAHGESKQAASALAAILGRREREAQPFDRIEQETFIDFAPELQVGVLLAQVHGNRGDDRSARSALETALRTFLRTVGHQLPGLLLHVRPMLLQAYQEVLPSVVDANVLGSTAPAWREASLVLAEGGRSALSSWQAARPLRTGRRWERDPAMHDLLEFTEMRLGREGEGLIASLEEEGHSRRARAIRVIAEKTVEGLRQDPASTPGHGATTA